MSTPLSSMSRGTPSLAVPSTQNTAPVIKYRCLYTHDLRRKAKRWHDGYLRYHTFNRRVMVYDSPGNFIGDLHWRDDGEIQDGDEMELDKGVLVQVGECMEKTQTDLSSLFEKKRTSQGSPQARDALTNSNPRMSTPARSYVSSQTPRSLNDLLGIRKNPLGRACVSKSPYEERHPPASSANTPAEDRAPKRRKVLAAENRLREKSTNAPIRSSPVVVDLSDDTSVTPKPKPTVRPLSTAPSKPNKKSDSTNVNKNSVSNPIEHQKIAKCSDKASESTQPKRIGGTPPVSQRDKITGSRSSSAPGQQPETPVNALRIAPEQPRKKLMYRALLPSQPSQIASTDTASSSARSKHRSSADQVNPQSVCYWKLREILSADCCSPPEDEVDLMKPHVAHDEFDPGDSTLFLFDGILERQLEPGAQQSDVLRSREDDKPQMRANWSICPLPRANTASGISPRAPASRAPGPSLVQTHPIQTKNNRTPFNTRQPLNVTIPRNPAVPSNPPKSHSQEALPDLASTRNTLAQKSLQKCTSDPTALVGTLGLHSRKPMAQSPLDTLCDPDGTQMQGPWTVEALDLFDFWPPGRPKPG